MTADRQRLKTAVLAEVVQEALEMTGDQQVHILREAIDLSSALEAIGSGPSTSRSQHDWLVGSAAALLGVQPEDVEAELPSTAQIKDAVQHLLPRIESRLAERCQQLAAAASYDSSSYDGLADHLQQLNSSADRNPGVQSWAKAVMVAQQTLQLLVDVNQVLVAIISQYKLKKQQEADEARAAFLQAQCTMLLEKLKVVEAQLMSVTYTQATLPALQRVSQHLEGAVAEAAGKLRQAATRLAQYRALGPRFEALVHEHAVVQRQISETHYQLQEVEQFQRLQQVIG